MRILIILAMAIYIAVIPKSCSLIDFQLTKEQKELIYQAVNAVKKIFDPQIIITPLPDDRPIRKLIAQNEEVETFVNDTMRLIHSSNSEGRLIQQYDSLDVPVLADVERVIKDTVDVHVLETVKAKIDSSIAQAKSAVLDGAASLASDALLSITKSIF